MRAANLMSSGFEDVLGDAMPEWVEGPTNANTTANNPLERDAQARPSVIVVTR